MDAMVVLGAGNASEEILLGIGFVVAVLVGEDHDAIPYRDQHLVAEHAHAVR